MQKMASDDISEIVPLPKIILNVTGHCFDYVRVFSMGMWNLEGGNGNLLEHSLFRFHLQLLIFVSLASFFHFFLRRFNFPRLCSEILAGFVVGPTFLEIYFPGVASALFNSVYFLPGMIGAPNVVMVSISRFGYFLFVFLVGVRMDPSLMWKTGRTAPILGILLALLSEAMTMSLSIRFLKTVNYAGQAAFSRNNLVKDYYSTMTSSQFVATSSLLLQLKITNSRLGRMALATQLASELFTVGFSVLRKFSDMWVLIRPTTSIQAMFLCSALLGLLVFPVRQMLYYFIRKTPEGQLPTKLHTNLVVLCAIAFCIFSELAALGIINGPFLLGLMVPAGSPLAQDLIAKLDPIASGTLVPLMVTFGASKFGWLWFVYELPVTCIASMVGYVIKLMVTFLILLCFKFSQRDSYALTLILNNKGIVEVGRFFLGNIEFQDVESTSGFLLVLIIASIVPPLVKLLYDPEKQYIGHNKKCIQFASPNSELKILACAHKQEDAMAAIKLLDLSKPTKESPLSVFGLCLEELVASSNPVLINHQLGQKTTSSFGSRSQPIIDVFKYFEAENVNLAQVQIFTAISPLKQLHEDICFLSFDKAASLIILPFHKKWNSKTKKLMPDHNDLRTLNIDVLNRAPCSVAILLDRRGSTGLSTILVHTKTYRIAVPFIGGPDDREALAYALRIAGSSRVELTAVKLYTEQTRGNPWDSMLDSEMLRNLKLEMSRNRNIRYIEQVVEDGSGTAKVVRELTGSQDLVIVGRRHEDEPESLSGLSEWTEIPELGPLGDILVSPDIVHPVSVLVVQQQIMKASHSQILMNS